MGAARSPRSARRQIRLRRRLVRRLHGSCRRRAGALLCRPRVGCGGQSRGDHRGAGRRRFASACRKPGSSTRCRSAATASPGTLPTGPIPRSCIRRRLCSPTASSACARASIKPVTVRSRAAKAIRSVHSRSSRPRSPSGSGDPSHNRKVAKTVASPRAGGVGRPCVINRPWMRFHTARLAFRTASRSRCNCRSSSAVTLGTRTSRHPRGSPAVAWISWMTKATASRRSVFARRARRSTAMLDGSTTTLLTPAAVNARCNQNPSRPAS